ncbi:MAG: hypothetical protein HKM24_00265, partial [Gammaproteobacteria bacterium]|nr:hypothetical protein [Gammaproteobacteria bacterium]
MSTNTQAAASSAKSLQDTYGFANICFGCGPSNEKGLQIKSFVDDNELVCEWT